MDLVNRVRAYALAGGLGAAVMVTPYNAEANERKQIVNLMTQTNPVDSGKTVYVRDFPLKDGVKGILASYNSDSGLLLLYVRGSDNTTGKVYHFRQQANSFVPRVDPENGYHEALSANMIYERFLRATGLSKEKAVQTESYVSRANGIRN